MFRPLASQFITSSLSRRAFLTATETSPLRTPFRRLFWGSLFAFPAAYALTQSLHLDAPATVDVVVDPDTSIEFPKTLGVPSKVHLPTLTLLGVGVRTVSFLGIKVYSVGFYADLANPNLKIPRSASPEEKIGHIIDNTACLLRIVPTRNTSYTHLRDAFVRTLQARLQRAHKDGVLSKEDELGVQVPIGKIKTLFPNTAFAKHAPLDILLAPVDPGQPRTLVVRDLGAIQHTWVARELILSYFDGEGNSPPMKKAVWKALEDFGLP